MTHPPAVLKYAGTLGWTSGNNGGSHKQSLVVMGIPNDEASYGYR